MPATGDGRAPGAGEAPSALAGAPEGRAADGRAPSKHAAASHARSRPGRREGSAPSAVAPAPIPHPRSTAATSAGAPASGSATSSVETAPLKVLVIEDNASDARLIASAVAESGASIEVHWARGLDHAVELLAPAPPWTRRNRPRGPDFGCVLLDLAAPGTGAAPAAAGAGAGAGAATGTRADVAAPDALGWIHRPDLPPRGRDGGQGSANDLDGLRELLRRAPQTAVVVLTDTAGAELGAAAVAAGAQDFLIKQETNGPLLARALRYAVERKRADESQRRLVEAELRGQENARLQRHLLPTPCSTAPGSPSPGATARVAVARCSAATSTTPSAPTTARSTW